MSCLAALLHIVKDSNRKSIILVITKNQERVIIINFSREKRASTMVVYLTNKEAYTVLLHCDKTRARGECSQISRVFNTV